MNIIHGDCLEELKKLEDNSVDAIVTDPPYGLSNTKPQQVADVLKAWVTGDTEAAPTTKGGFMNASWDSFVPPPAVWEECMRVLKPGGHMAVFAGARTQDLMGLSIRLAGFEIRDTLGWIYGSGFPKSMDVSKAIDKAAGVEREVIGTRKKLDSYGQQAGNNVYGGGPNHDGIQAITAPATSEAAKWDGWGTALKPAIEPVIYAQKPLDNHGIVNLIGSHIYRLEAQCSSTAANAEQSSKHTPAESNGAMESTAHENAATHTGDSRGSETPTGNLREDSSEGTGTPLSGSMANTCPNTVMSWRASWEELCKLMSTSTTSTTTEVTTDLRTLLSCISQITVESTPASPTPALISGSHASVVGNLFAAIVGRLSATLELSAIENATSNIPTSSQGGGGETRTAIDPIILARKPLDGTVASNVLAHGVGGLNIDACRVPSDVPIPSHHGTSGAAGVTMGKYRDYVPGSETAASVENVQTAGRFPANVLLDEHAAKEMDKQSGPAGAHGPRSGRGTGEGVTGWMTPGTRAHPNDSGGASRFFPVFKYQAKAPKKERPVIERPPMLQLRDDLTPEQVDHVRARLQEVGLEIE